MNAEDQLFALHAEVCRTLGHPLRLKLIYLLGQGERSPGELAAQLGISASNLSQHLAALRAVGLVEVWRQGGRVRYRLTSGEVAQACDLMRQVLLGHLERQSHLLRLARGGQGGLANPEAQKKARPRR